VSCGAHRWCIAIDGVLLCSAHSCSHSHNIKHTCSPCKFVTFDDAEPPPLYVDETQGVCKEQGFLLMPTTPVAHIPLMNIGGNSDSTYLHGKNHNTHLSATLHVQRCIAYSYMSGKYQWHRWEAKIYESTNPYQWQTPCMLEAKSASIRVTRRLHQHQKQ